MPHVDEGGLPKTPPRDQKPVPKNSAANKARIGLMPVLDMHEFEPNMEQVERALGQEPTSGDNPNGLFDGLPR